jgi:elongation factor Tu
LAAATGGDKTLGKDAILKLMEAVEAKIPTPKRDLDKPFLMPVEDTFSIAGRGTVATGRVEQGVVKVGDDLDLIGIKAMSKTTCTGNNDYNNTFVSIIVLKPLLNLRMS